STPGARGRCIYIFRGNAVPITEQEVTTMEPNQTPGNLPREFLPPLGGEANIVGASRRGNRLSVSVKDESLADPNALARLPGVAGCTLQNGRVRIELTEQTHKTV